MATLSVSVPEKLKKRMGSLDEVNWSAVARKAFEKKIKEIEFLEYIGKKSKLTEKSAKKLGQSINKAIAKKFAEM